MSTKQMVTRQQKNNFIITKGDGIVHWSSSTCVLCVYVCECVSAGLGVELVFSLDAVVSRLYRATEGIKCVSGRSEKVPVFLPLPCTPLSSFLHVLSLTGFYLCFRPPVLQATSE